MAFPIRFKIIDRQTKQEVKGKDSYGNVICALLYPSGQIARMKQDFYTDVTQLSPRDYELHVATKKDDKGNWIYEKVGY